MEKPTKSKKAKISKGKKKVKTNNEDKYLNLLKKIDINLEEKEGKTANISESNEENLLISKEERILSVTDLLANLQEKNIKTSKIKQQITDLNARGVINFHL